MYFSNSDQFSITHRMMKSLKIQVSWVDIEFNVVSDNINGDITYICLNISNLELLGDPEVTANIYCKSCNLPNTDTQKHSTDLR